MMKTCSIEGCGKPSRSRGWCRGHYWRWSVHGDPLLGTTGFGEAQRYYREVVLAYDGDECLFWPFSKAGKGYGHVYADGRMQYVHLLVCKETHGPAPSPLHEAAHSCGNGRLACCTKRHLLWKTRSENHADKHIHGTMLRGNTHPRSKLTDQNVRLAKLMAGSHTQEAIAKKFGVSRSTISLAVNGKTWAHLTDGRLPQ